MMEVTKTEIRICLGSSCFARGNKKLVQVIQQFLKQNHLEEKVIFHGAHCFGQCGDGPNLSIGDDLLHANDPEEIKTILRKHFGV